MATPDVWSVNAPIPWPGDADTARLNYRTHHFVASGDPEDGDFHCWACDCKPGHKAASYPCGEEPPRETTWRVAGDPTPYKSQLAARRAAAKAARNA